jgi:hypothetical protein
LAQIGFALFVVDAEIRRALECVVEALREVEEPRLGDEGAPRDVQPEPGLERHD